MTVKIEVLDPQTESPSTLRALAHLFNVMASDKDGKPLLRAATVESTGEQVTELQGNQPAPPAAPGASDQSSTGPSTSAPAGSSTLDWSVLDANGLPWNEKIHSSSKNKNADQTWRYLRGGDTEVRAAVEAEMRAEGAALGHVVAEQTPPPPPPVAPNAADAPPPPPPVVTTAVDSAGDEITTAMVFKRASSLSKEQQGQALELVGLTAMGEFLKQSKEKPELVQSLWDAMVAITGEE